MTTAQAHPNIALVKYWGKQNRSGNFPATPSLSITLSGIRSETKVQSHHVDSLVLNGEESYDKKVEGFLKAARAKYDIPPLLIETNNNFPTGAGLASSASGFAALATAINKHCNLNLTTAKLSAVAREGSASAARSLFGGFVSLAGPNWQAAQLFDSSHWRLKVVIAVTEEGRKQVSSTEGMNISKSTSPYFDSWTQSTEQDYQAAVSTLAKRDFDKLASIAEHSCMKMHALMISSYPPLLYWNAGSLACIRKVQELRADGVEAFFTMDAGPQVKVICSTRSEADVSAAISRTPGVVRTITTGLGDGASVVS